MNTTTARYTPLESLLLFQSLLSHGIDAAAFLHISSLLQNSPLVKGSSHYDATRLSPEALQELFLHLLREELKAESENTEQSDGTAQSPNSRKRKLASPPLPTLQEARQHLAKLPLLVDRLYARYRDHVVRQIREDEERYESLQGDIDGIEAGNLAVKNVNNENARVTSPVSTTQNGPAAVPASGTSGEVKIPNGGPPTAQPPQQQPPALQPQPQPQYQQLVHPEVQLQPQPQIQQQQPQSQPQPQLQPQLQPLPPQLPSQAGPQFGVRSEDTRNGTITPQPLPSPRERPDNATPPVLTPQHSAAPQNQPNRLAAPAATLPVPQQEQLRPPNGPQVLQPPQGVGFPTPRHGPVPHQVQGEGLQRPEGIGRGKTSPAPLSSQPTVPGQLKWEPLYQPNQFPPQYRHPPAQGQFPQQRQSAGPQAPQGAQHPSQSQWSAQVPSPYGSPRPPHVQPGPPLNQPVQQPLQQPVEQQPSLQQPVQQHAQQQMHQPHVPQQAQQQMPQPQALQQAQQQQRQQSMHQAIQHPVPQPALVPPQRTGQFSPALQPAPARTPADRAHALPPSRSPALGQTPGQERPPQPPGLPPAGGYATHAPPSVFQPPPQNRALAAASPTPPPGPTQGPLPPQQHKRTGQTLGIQQPIAQRSPPVLHQSGPPVAGPSGVPSYAPHNGQGRSAIPEHVLQQQPTRQHTGAATPTPLSRASPVNVAPQTPLPPFRRSYLLGSGTSWKLDRTPSTPRAEVGEVPSPAYEPLSPVLAPAVPPASPPIVPPTLAPLPPVSPTRTTTPLPETAKSVPAKEPQGSVSPIAKRRGRPPRSAQNVPGPSLPTLVPPPAAPQPAPSPKGPLQSMKDPESTLIKHEETTPQPPTETGDTTADESVTGRRQVSRAVKRKRQDTASPTPVGSREPPGPPTHVMWTRSFNKVSHSAMEQIVGHRDANLFAHQIRERDAPGYRNRILMPQDLKSIRNAINHGNRAAAAAAAALPDGDPGTSSVLLPISEELVPPRGIVNSSQLDRELAHMLANAIMYNPDPNRGPGPAFMRSEAEVDAEDEENGAPVLGYKVDENGIVNNARAMFVEVEKLLSDMRAAEIQKGAPAAAAALTGTSTRQASVAGGLNETPVKRDEPGSSTTADDREEQTPTEPETTGNVSKRRRITRG